MPEDDTGNPTRPRPTPDPENQNPGTNLAPASAHAPAPFSQPQLHQLEDDDYDHYGDDEQEEEDNDNEREREREHSPTLPPQQQPIQQVPPQQQQQQQQSQPTPTLVAHVHFHSRVRITSGLRHSRGTRALDDSSDSDSPSSSISVPLRFRSGDSMQPRPLVERVSRLAAKTLQKRRAAAAIASSTVSRLRPRDDDEFAPLFRAARVPVTYGAVRYGHSMNDRADGGRDELHREDDIEFGKWPWRALNRHWWKWQIESTLRCCCSDESDAGE